MPGAVWAHRAGRRSASSSRSRIDASCRSWEMAAFYFNNPTAVFAVAKQYQLPIFHRRSRQLRMGRGEGSDPARLSRRGKPNPRACIKPICPEVWTSRRSPKPPEATGKSSSIPLETIRRRRTMLGAGQAPAAALFFMSASPNFRGPESGKARFPGRIVSAHGRISRLAPTRPASFWNAASHLMSASGKARSTPSFSTNLDAARAAADQSTDRWKAGANRCHRSTGCPSASRTSSKPPICRRNKDRRSSKAGARCAISAGRRGAARGRSRRCRQDRDHGIRRGRSWPDPQPVGHVANAGRLEQRLSCGRGRGRHCLGRAGDAGSRLYSSALPAIAAALDTSPASARSTAAVAFDYLSQSCAGVLAATLPELWIVAREISARVGGDPGFPGLSGPRDSAGRSPAEITRRSANCRLSHSLHPEAATRFRRVCGKGCSAKRHRSLYTRDNTPLAVN